MKKQIAALGLCAAMVVGAATGCSATASKETEKTPAADAARRIQQRLPIRRRPGRI